MRKQTCKLTVAKLCTNGKMNFECRKELITNFQVNFETTQVDREWLFMDNHVFPMDIANDKLKKSWMNYGTPLPP